MHSSKEMRRLNHLISETDAAYHEAALKCGLSDSAMQILYTIWDHGGRCLLREICSLTGISKQTLNSAIRKLENEDILLLEANGAKNKMVHLTPSGKHLAAQTVSKIIEAENHIFSSWNQEDVEKYLELTKRYLEAFREETRHMTRGISEEG